MEFRHLPLLLGLVLSTCSLAAQISLPLDHSLDHRGCELPVVESDLMYQRPYAFRKGVRPKELVYTVDYVEDGRKMFGDTCHAWPEEAKTALEYAISIWSDVLQNDQSIDIQACFSPDMPTGTLGSASPTMRIAGGYLNDTVVLPQALIEHLINFGLSDPTNPDIQIIVNKNYNFYYGTDANPPGTQVDFVTLAIHELGHGLGFVGSARLDDGDPTNGVECNGTDSTGCIGYYANYNGVVRHYATPYDLFVDVGSDGSRAFDLPNDSREMHDVLLGQSAGLFFDDTNEDTYYVGNATYPLYTPAKWRQGSSYSHFKDPSEALYYALSKGSAVHDVGRASEVMQNMGWSKAIAPSSALPVDLVSFAAARQGPTVELRWETSREIDHDFFVVEARRDDGNFREIGRVNGSANGEEGASYHFQDRQPATGANYYRLRQVDYTGQETLSYVVGVRMQPTEVVVGNPFPNPTYDGIVHLDYESDVDRELVVYTVSTTGRVVSRFRQRIARGGNRLSFDLTNHPAGVYALILGDGSNRVQRRFLRQ